MQDDAPRPQAKRQWRPRFSVRGLLVLTLIVGLCVALVLQHRQVEQAEQILASNGLAWDRPIADDEVRVNVTLKNIDEYSAFAILVVRVQTTSPGTIRSTGADPTPTVGLVGMGKGMWTGEYFVFSEFVGLKLSRYNRVSGDGSVNMGPWQGSRGQGVILDEVDPVVKPGIYKRGEEIPIYKRHGKIAGLIVK